MVALHQRYEPDGEPAGLSDARGEVERLGAGLSVSLLATSPDVLRMIAERARRAEATVARWQARVGDRPPLDPAAEAAVVAAVEEIKAARADHDAALRARHRLLATGNSAGMVGLGAAAGFVLLGVSPMALPVAVAVAASPIGPLIAAWRATQRCSLAARRVGTARAAWVDALDATGASTMGDLAARRIAVAAWERRGQEAEAAVEAARPQRRAWYRLAGPGVAPSEVEELVARLEALRQAQLRLLGCLFSEVLERRAMDVLAPAGELAQPSAPPSWLGDALDRLRGSRRLRLWNP